MTLEEAMIHAHEFGNPWDDYTQEAAITLAAEVRRLQAENASLRLYSPARRATETVKTDPVGECNDEYWRLAHETDEEFAAKGRAYVEVTE